MFISSTPDLWRGANWTAPVLEYPPGRRLFEQGYPGDAVYLIQRGLVKLGSYLVQPPLKVEAAGRSYRMIGQCTEKAIGADDHRQTDQVSESGPPRRDRLKASQRGASEPPR